MQLTVLVHSPFVCVCVRVRGDTVRVEAELAPASTFPSCPQFTLRSHTQLQLLAKNGQRALLQLAHFSVLDSTRAAMRRGRQLELTRQDADNVYALARQPTHLGRQTQSALGIIEQALDQYR